MPRSLTLLLALATLSATASAQNANPAGPGNSDYMQSQPAPIERAAPSNNAPRAYGHAPRTNRPTVTRPIPGVVVRVSHNGSMSTISADTDRTELRLDHGVANVSVHQPEKGPEILVNLPGGQTALVKDGIYTFNAETNTVRVLKGEAAAFPGSQDVKPIKVKEDHQLVFGAAPVRSVEVNSLQARADLLPGSHIDNPERGYGDGGSYGDGFYGGGFYGGFDDYPYYGYGSPYGLYGYPYGYGFGLGFGYYGGYGYRGGFHGGGGGFHGHR
jgi:hypothetical protein